MLEQFESLKRLELVDLLLQKEEELLQLEWDVHKRVKNRINQNQREYYLREQLKVIQQELAHGQNYDGGDEDEEYFEGEDGDEIAEYMERINKACAGAPDEIKQKLVKETKRMAKMPYGSAESGILRNYLDTCLEYPWTTQTEDCVDVARAREILNHDHDGQKEVKDRILEYLAAQTTQPITEQSKFCVSLALPVWAKPPFVHPLPRRWDANMFACLWVVCATRQISAAIARHILAPCPVVLSMRSFRQR